MNSKKLVIKKKNVVLFLTLIPCFEPTFFSTISVLSNLYNFLTLVSVAYLILCVYKEHRHLSTISILLLTFELWLLTVTVLQRGEITYVIWDFLQVSIIIFVVMLLNDEWEALISILLVHFELCVYINLLTVIIFPERMYGRSSAAYGLTHEWFLGGNHNFLMWLYPAVSVALIYMYTRKKRTRPITLIAAVICTYILQNSITGVVGVAILLMLTIIPFINKILTPLITFVITIGIFVLIILFRKFSAFSWIIVVVLNKDLTFTNRLPIWDNAISAFFDCPIYGHGVLSNNKMVSYLGWAGATHCHNEFLQIAFVGGIVGVALFIAIQIVMVRRMSNIWSDRVAQVLIYSLAGFNIMGLTEPLNEATMFLIFVLGGVYIGNKNKKYFNYHHRLQKR